jgi:hypothetical protein
VCSASGKTRKVLHVNLCCAYAESISSHTEHTRNEFQRWSSTLGTDLVACQLPRMRGNARESNILAESTRIFNKLMLQALWTIWLRFLQYRHRDSCLCVSRAQNRFFFIILGRFVMIRLALYYAKNDANSAVYGS